MDGLDIELRNFNDYDFRSLKMMAAWNYSNIEREALDVKFC